MEFKVIPNEQTPAVPFDPVLWTNNINVKLEQLKAFLEFAKTRENAVGLAANQCAVFAGEGEDEDGMRFMVRAFALRDMKTREWSLILEPKIRCFGIKEIKAEGCLTWKGQTIVAERSRFVEVSYYDMDGTYYKDEIYKGFEAQIWQHEVNHLNGVDEDVRDMFIPPPPLEAGRNEPCPCGSGKKYKKCCLI